MERLRQWGLGWRDKEVGLGMWLWLDKPDQRMPEEKRGRGRDGSVGPPYIRLNGSWIMDHLIPLWSQCLSRVIAFSSAFIDDGIVIAQIYWLGRSTGCGITTLWTKCQNLPKTTEFETHPFPILRTSNGRSWCWNIHEAFAQSASPASIWKSHSMSCRLIEPLTLFPREITLKDLKSKELCWYLMNIFGILWQNLWISFFRPRSGNWTPLGLRTARRPSPAPPVPQPARGRPQPATRAPSSSSRARRAADPARADSAAATTRKTRWVEW